MNIHWLIRVIVQIIVLAIVVGILFWIDKEINFGDPFEKVIHVAIVLVAGLGLIGIVLNAAGLLPWKKE